MASRNRLAVKIEHLETQYPQVIYEAKILRLISGESKFEFMQAGFHDSFGQEMRMGLTSW